jgi:WD40 repeat protein
VTGDAFAFAGSSSVFLVSTADGHLIQDFDIPPPKPGVEFYVRNLKISRDSRFLAVCGPSSDVIMYSLSTGRQICSLEHHTRQISSLLFSNDSTLLYSVGFDGILCIWDMNSMKLETEISPTGVGSGNTPEIIRSLAGNEEGSFLAVGFLTGSVGIYDSTFKQPMNRFSAHQDSLTDVATSPFDGTIATSSNDKTTKIWSLRGAASLKKTLTGHTDYVLSASFSPLDAIVFTGSKDETIKAWNYKQGELIFTLKCHTNTIFAVVHHPTKKMFISCGGDKVICLWRY